jgi:hypothetical protein
MLPPLTHISRDAFHVRFRRCGEVGEQVSDAGRNEWSRQPLDAGENIVEYSDSFPR